MSEVFVSDADIELGDRYQENGYVIVPAANPGEFQRIQKLVVDSVAAILGVGETDPKSLLNGIHEKVSVGELNSFRLEMIRRMNAESWFRSSYFDLARPTLERIVGNELAMQLRVNLSIQLPEDDGSLLPVHADVWSGDSPFETVVWVPLVDCFDSKAMYLLPPAADQELRKNFGQYVGSNSEELFEKIKNQVVWIEIKAGEVLVFNQNLPHGNRVNKTSETRWSMNCRFKGVFTPYGDKKLGEFFEPITLKAASRLGMAYQFPSLHSDPEE